MKVTFITHDNNAKELWDDEGLIGNFTDAKMNLQIADDGIARRVGVGTWFMVLEDEKKIERVKKYPGFGTAFKVYEGAGISKVASTLRTLSDPNAAVQNNNAELDKLKADKLQMQKDSQEYAVLYSKVAKSDGGYVKNAKPEDIARFEELKKKMGLEEVAA